MSYDAVTSLAYETGKTGTGWTVDVTPCRLSIDLTDKDFKVWINDTLASNSDFTKTSAVLLTYGGTATSSATVEVHRSTTVSRIKTIASGEALSVSDIENELERILRVEAELQAFYQEDPPAGQAGAGDIIGTAFGVTWDGKTSQTATKNNLYTTIENEAPLASPTFTGTPTAPDIANTLGAGNYTAANRDSTDAILQYRFTNSPALTTSPAANTDDTTPATTAFVKSSSRVFKETDVLDISATLDYSSAGSNLINDSIDFGSDTYDLLVFAIRSYSSPTSEPPTTMTIAGRQDCIDLDDSDAAEGSWCTTDCWIYWHINDFTQPVWYWAYFPGLTGSHTVHWKGEAVSARSNIDAEFRMQLIAFPTS